MKIGQGHFSGHVKDKWSVKENEVSKTARACSEHFIVLYDFTLTFDGEDCGIVEHLFIGRLDVTRGHPLDPRLSNRLHTHSCT